MPILGGSSVPIVGGPLVLLPAVADAAGGDDGGGGIIGGTSSRISDTWGSLQSGFSSDGDTAMVTMYWQRAERPGVRALL